MFKFYSWKLKKVNVPFHIVRCVDIKVTNEKCLVIGGLVVLNISKWNCCNRKSVNLMVIDFEEKNLTLFPREKAHGHNWILDICRFLYYKTAPMGLWVPPPSNKTVKKTMKVTYHMYQERAVITLSNSNLMS